MILFKKNGKPYSSANIKNKIDGFGNSYNNAVKDIIGLSRTLDQEGTVFIKCAARLLSNFKMTRRGPFEGLRISKEGHVKGGKILKKCWGEIGREIFEIKSQVIRADPKQQGRFLLNLSEKDREKIIKRIWASTKKLLPHTMGETTYGLVGASKILFSVLPEIVLPVDNTQWLQVFRTVDLGDVIRKMTNEIELWEKNTGGRFDLIDQKQRLTTLPSVYNVMAMNARS
jgi:hypothetical protein